MKTVLERGKNRLTPEDTVSISRYSGCPRRHEPVAAIRFGIAILLRTKESQKRSGDERGFLLYLTRHEMPQQRSRVHLRGALEEVRRFLLLVHRALLVFSELPL